MELVILMGLQASGKSTFVQTYLSKTHVHISKDLMRNNKRKNRRQLQLLVEALEAERSVVIDNTNPTVEDRVALIKQGHNYGAEIIGYYFQSSLQDCLARNQQRLRTARVPDVGVFATVKQFVRPSYDEGFDRLMVVEMAPHRTFRIEPYTPTSEEKQ